MFFFVLRTVGDAQSQTAPAAGHNATDDINTTTANATIPIYG